MASRMEKTIDTKALEQLGQLQVPGGRDIVAYLISRYVELAPDRIAQMEAALAGDNRESLKHLAHTLKSSSAYVGAAKVTEVCAQLETAAPLPEFGGRQLGSMIQELKRELSAAREALLHWSDHDPESM